jgi:hypothetical protein
LGEKCTSLVAAVALLSAAEAVHSQQVSFFFFFPFGCSISRLSENAYVTEAANGVGKSWEEEYWEKDCYWGGTAGN